MSSIWERWRQYRKDVYRAGFIAGAEAWRRGDPEPSWRETLKESWRFAINSDFVKEERFRESDPWHRKVNHRRMLGFSLVVSGWLANAADGLLKVVEWTLVIALFKFLASETQHPAFDAIATTLFVALVIYISRHFIPFVLFEARTRTLPSILFSTAVSLATILAAIVFFAAIGELVQIVAVNQSIL